MDGIFQQSRIQLIDLRANVEKQEVMLEPLLSATPFDSAKAMLQIDKVADARAELEKANAKMLLGIRGVLTPDQWTKLNTHGGPAGGPAAQGGPGGPGQPGAPGGGQGGGQGRGRGMRRGGGPPPNAANFVEPIDVP
jgi:Spy/CpxP family protein refolding chaperone